MDSSCSEKFNKYGFLSTKIEGWQSVGENLKKDLKGIFNIPESEDLENLHHYKSTSEINDVRLRAIAYLNKSDKFINDILEPFSPFLEELIGPDILRQKRLNLVIHMPEDETSVIPIHSDVLTGNSPFEVGLWLPLTKCNKENSMFILPYQLWKEERIGKTCLDSSFVPLLPQVGEVIFFKHFLPHGNILNESNETRISLNVRFKHLWAPENKKNLVNYYEIFKSSEFTKIGLTEWKNEY